MSLVFKYSPGDLVRIARLVKEPQSSLIPELVESMELGTIYEISESYKPNNDAIMYILVDFEAGVYESELELVFSK